MSSTGSSSTYLLTIRKCLELLPSLDRRKLFIVSGIQSFTAVLDLLGILILGFVGGLAVSGVQSHEPSASLRSLLSYLKLENSSLQLQVGILVLVATLILITKTVISIVLGRRTLFFLGQKSAEVSSNLMSRMLVASLPTIQKYSTQEIIFNLTTGVESATVRLLGAIINAVADLSLLILVSIGLAILDPILALSVLLLFGLISMALYWNMHTKAEKLGRENSDFEIKSREKISEAVSSYREIVVHGRRQPYLTEISTIRSSLAKTSAEIAFLPSIGKYVFEASLVVGSVCVGSVQFFLNDAVHAVSSLTLFLAAGSRIAPALLRIQQNAIQIRGSVASARPTLDFENELPIELLNDQIPRDFDPNHNGFKGSIFLDNVSYTYPNSQSPALKSISFSIPEGNTLAIVGSSGAGKSTLADVLLGILNPDSGLVLISDTDPLSAILKWPGAISYVPQTVSLVNGTILSNVVLGAPFVPETKDLISQTLKKAQLQNFLTDDDFGLNYSIGENGSNLSGGQRQRLSLARALFTQPKLLVLDETTSGLDSQTEHEITKTISALKSQATVVIIAHRLSTVRNADQIVYLANGELVAQGTFDELRAQVPDFDIQANLLNL